MPSRNPPSLPPYYELLGVIAHGASGDVYRARDRRLRKEIALKVFGPGFDSDRVLREAQILARLTHPGILRLCELNDLPGGGAYMVTELVEGRALAEIAHESDSSPEMRGRLVAAFGRVCQALAYAHSQGVIHRNLTPWKVMFAESGAVCVMGWSEARVLAEPEPPLKAMPPTMIGAPVYVAPERIRNERGDARTDVFGLGGLLCFILTGRPPHPSGEGVVAIVKRCIEGDFSDTFARLDACGADPHLIAVAKRCLAPNPADRYADAAEVANAVGFTYQAETPFVPAPTPWWGTVVACAIGAFLAIGAILLRGR